jgi:hypothetical protein
MSTMPDALRTIIAGSPDAARDAMDCLRAISVKSPVLQQRYNHTVQIALSDPQAAFTPDERALLARYVDTDESDRRSIVQPVRLSPDERQQLEDDAGHAGLSLSDYIRQRLFGG